ncbi:site-specific integrase [Reichenbachiella carrageenanivorans]|uniref:Site-specific integrase n=1 Tax=Reichenbachiella carrageenanivorans TaxID=2979869 RepID=A0ABY6CVS3_9BACT|nr:site-specific integrase [Reichenbachiella carrageenanivorans]UXX78014.1 site-specific integrase [Reichenbachiella carrageenanivorans]
MKKYPSISVVHNRLNYKSKSGLSPVYLRIYHKGKTDYALLDIVPPIHKRDWIGDTHQDLYVLKPEINRIIRDILFHTRDWVQDRILMGHPLTVKEIKEHLQLSKTNETFNEFIDRYIRHINKRKSDEEKLSPLTVQTYRSFEVRLNEFRPDIRFDDLTPTFIYEFERFLAVDCKLRGVTRVKHFDKFKICYRAALKEGLVKLDVKLMFDDLKIKQEKSRRVSLTQAELRALRDTTLPDPRDEFFKNIFLFGCLTGLYYSDIRNLTHANIEEIKLEDNEESVRYIAGHRSKNDEEFVIPIFPDTQKILDRFSSWNKDKKPSKILLFKELISDQKFNLKLKSIASQLEIDKEISAKVARHSFTEMMVSLGVPIKKVGRALGHQKTSTTEIYGRQSKANAMRGWIDLKL